MKTGSQPGEAMGAKTLRHPRGLQVQALLIETTFIRFLLTT